MATMEDGTDNAPIEIDDATSNGTNSPGMEDATASGTNSPGKLLGVFAFTAGALASFVAGLVVVLLTLSFACYSFHPHAVDTTSPKFLINRLLNVKQNAMFIAQVDPYAATPDDVVNNAMSMTAAAISQDKDLQGNVPLRRKTKNLIPPFLRFQQLPTCLLVNSVRWASQMA
jgi:hypothetical protein